jgi:hypothetical protein
MNTPTRTRILAAALLALGVSPLFAQPGAAGAAAPGAPRGGGQRGGALGAGALGQRGGGAAVPLPDINTLKTALTLTDAQASAIVPLLDEVAKAQQDLTTKQTAANDTRNGLSQKIGALLNDAQKTQLAALFPAPGGGARGGAPAAGARGGGAAAPNEDHQNMLAQLGITQLRPGKSGSNQTGPGFILETANPWKDTMPDVLKMKNGTMVTRADQWPARRKEILEDFEREVYGRIPANVPKVTWEVTGETQANANGVPTIRRTLVGHVDNSAYPGITVNIQADYTIPANATGPVPLFLSFGGGAQQAIARGWGSGSITPTSIQADSGGNSLRQGIIGLTNKGEFRKPDDWGALRAWGWGVSKLIDYFEQHPEAGVNPRAVTIEGVSRYGKAALVTMAFDERVASALVASSGEGGAKLHRHDFGEAVENLTATGEYHWMAGNFLKYGAAAPKKMDAGDLPVDSHELIALCAPRPVFISYGVEAAGDPKWVGAPGSYMAGILASPVYEVLGKKGYGVNPADYITAPMPAVEQLVGGELAWRQHAGGHTSGPNIVPFLDWIAAYIKAPALRQ